MLPNQCWRLVSDGKTKAREFRTTVAGKACFKSAKKISLQEEQVPIGFKDCEYFDFVLKTFISSHSRSLYHKTASLIR